MYYNIPVSVMSIINPTRSRLLSEMFVNLSAGWIGVVLIAPGFEGLDVFMFLGILAKNLVFATLSLLFAEWLLGRFNV